MCTLHAVIVLWFWHQESCFAWQQSVRRPRGGRSAFYSQQVRKMGLTYLFGVKGTNWGQVLNWGLSHQLTWKFGVDQIRHYNFVNYCGIKCIFTCLVVLVCQQVFCLGLWIKSCGLVNYCTIRAIVKIKMVLKVCCTETFRQDLRRGRQASCWITLWALWMIALQRTKIYQSIKDRQETQYSTMVFLGVGVSPVHRRGHGESVFSYASTLVW